MLYWRLFRQLVPPAVDRFARALKQVIQDGGRPISELVREVMALAGEYQKLPEFNVPNQVDFVILADGLCATARKGLAAGTSKRTLETLQAAIVVAHAVGADKAAKAAEEDLQKALNAEAEALNP
jgi:hypothetical protein